MSGRNPHESHRASTPLELLFDLTFVSAFGLAASQLASALTDARYAASLASFGFASGAICWAWINFSWFSSAYDTDDSLFRVVTMVQMIGVLVLAIGLQRMFASVERGEHLDNSVMVFGYVIMRVALVFQWLRAAKQDRNRRRACLVNALTISIAQIGWVTAVALNLSGRSALGLGSVLVAVELAGPVLAETRYGGTPWHSEHIAERYGLFAIIALGEGIVGAVAALGAVVAKHGWTLDTALVGVAGTGLTFGMWWLYQLLPSAETLQRHRPRAFAWSCSQMAIATAIVATGAGLRVSAAYMEGQSRIGAVATLLTVAIPFAVFLTMQAVLRFELSRRFDAFDIRLLGASASIVATAVVVAVSGLGMAQCLLILAASPVATIIGYEGRRHRPIADARARS